ncbi:uncharacterized protein si:ch211-269k10.4 isoform X2 [Brienomyrus brachyistius]|uniref:uncharacterized protein si:ch211-269k10.4 isoform X2 n=1 Tax=Brienomyrus brachyistius TaxID=42636 RepID=UPI0020B200EA|nr:uncharacterized protein si:ch211-269k10.4 isoform X2 [Brienomyrus brachyistius]
MAASEIVEESEATEPLFKQYKANEVLEIKKPRLHKLLEKQPMSMGAFQTICGITIFGLGIVTATSEEVTLGILLRVPILTGILFFFSGLLSFLLYKFPAFLHVSYVVNVGSFLVAGIGVILLSVDIYFWNSRKGVMRVQAIILGVTLAEMMVTAVLLYLLHVERNREKDSGLQ